MINLILTMLDAHDQYGNDLNFTKKDTDNFIKKYNVLDNLEQIDCNERGHIVLWKNKYLTNEQLAKHLDLKYEDEKFWLVIDSFDDILSDKYETEIAYLDIDGDIDREPSSYADHRIDTYYWSTYTEETLKKIIEYCIDQGIEIENDDDDYELMTTENTYLKTEKNGKQDIYFKYKNGNEIKLVTLIDNDEFDELNHALNIAIDEAQDDADYSDAYDEIKENFEKGIGAFEYKTVGDSQKIYIKLNITFKQIEEWFEECYGEFNFDEGGFGSLLYVLKEMEYFDFKKPYYDHISGSIDDDLLNEFTRNRLDW